MSTHPEALKSLADDLLLLAAALRFMDSYRGAPPSLQANVADHPAMKVRLEEVNPANNLLHEIELG